LARICFSVTDKKPLVIALSLTFLMMIIEVIGGILSGSLALLSDAGHMLTDTMALSICLLAAVFASRPATKNKTYGFYRLEILSALFNGAILMLIAIYIFYTAIRRIIDPVEVSGGLMLIVAIAGLAINLAGAFVLHRGSKENLNVKGAFLHVVSDAVSSVGVVVGGLIIISTGWYLIDPILGILIGVLILRGALSLVFESVNILLEAAPKELDIEAVGSAIKKIKGIIDVHDIHIWTISSGNYAFSTHIKVDDILISKSDAIVAEINRLLKDRFGIVHTTLQFECETCAVHEH